MQTVNKYEFAAREIKVDSLLRFILAQAGSKRISRAAYIRTAEMLRNLPQRDRDIIARQAHVNPPSDTTWTQLCNELQLMAL